MQDFKFEISLKVLLSVFIIIVSLWLLFQIKEVVVILIFSFILTSALNPLSDKLEKRMPRILGITFIYLAMVLIFSILLLLVIPALVNQIGVFLKNIPMILEQLLRNTNLTSHAQDVTNILDSQLSNLSANILNITSNIFNSVSAIIFTGVLSFYLLLEHRQLEKRLLNFFPQKDQERIFQLLLKIENKLGAWLRGELVLWLSIGLLAWLGLTVIGIEFAIPLAIIAGSLEIIPAIGPTIAIIPAALVALISSPLQGILTIVWYLMVQQTENAFLVPRIMSSAVNLNPLVVLLSILIGSKLMGVTGILLAVPTVAVLSTLFDDYLENRD
jgi:predicted PurR-regulated permease PerM